MPRSPRSSVFATADRRRQTTRFFESCNNVLSRSPQVPVRTIPEAVRAHAYVRVVFARAGAGTEAAVRYETGGLRMRFPKAGGRCEGVLINSAGGIAGGDIVGVACEVQAGAVVTLTTQSAEKIYSAEGPPAQLCVDLSLADKATLIWLPQETILFDGAALVRQFNVSMSPSATLLALESTVFGRVAAAEQLDTGQFLDRWRVRRDGRLIFADSTRLSGAISRILAGPACGDGARAVATLLYAAPDAEARLPGLRRLFAKTKGRCAASAFQGMLVARFAAADPADLRAAVVAAAQALLPQPLPRVWSC